jgi:hypothetical protein
VLTVDTALGDRQDADDHGDRADEQQQLVPSALVGDDLRDQRHTGHHLESTGNAD